MTDTETQNSQPQSAANTPGNLLDTLGANASETAQKGSIDIASHEKNWIVDCLIAAEFVQEKVLNSNGNGNGNGNNDNNGSSSISQADHEAVNSAGDVQIEEFLRHENRSYQENKTEN
jgi:hypothetical protein